MYVCMYVCMHVQGSIYASTYIAEDPTRNVTDYLEPAPVCVQTCLHAFICMYVCMSVYVCMYVYTHTCSREHLWGMLLMYLSCIFAV
jgi:nuclear pore complex protein Nup62